MMLTTIAIISLFHIGATPDRAETSQPSELEAVWDWMQAETVVSASKRSESIEDAPASVTVISSKEIEATQVAGFLELFRRVPNMTLIHLSNYVSQLYQRGRPSAFDSQTLVLLDWQNMNMAITGGAPWAALPVNVSDIERIEIVHGPGAALFGANAYAGVIHIITKKSRTSPTLRARASYGEYDTLQLETQTMGGMGDWSYRVSAGSQASASQSPYPRPGSESTRANGHVTYHHRADQSLSLNWGALQSVGTAITPLGDFHQKDLKRFNLMLAWESPKWTLRSYLNQVVNGDSYLDVDFYLFAPSSVEGINDFNAAVADGTEPIVGLILPNLDFTGSNLTWDTELVHSLDDFLGGSLTSGLNSRVVKDEADNMVEELPNEYRAGLFGQYQISPSQRWLMTAGLRADVDSTGTKLVNPRVNLQYTTPGGGKVRAAYIQAFRKPSIFETHYKFRSSRPDNPFVESMDRTNDSESLRNPVTLFQALAAQLPGNPDLKPEKVYGLELGYRDSFWNQRIKLEVDSYYYLHRDTIRQRSPYESVDTSECDSITVSLEKTVCDLGIASLFRNTEDGEDSFGLSLTTSIALTSELLIWTNGTLRETHFANKRWPWSSENTNAHINWAEIENESVNTSYGFYRKRKDIPHWQLNGGIDYRSVNGINVSLSAHGVAAIEEVTLKGVRSWLFPDTIHRVDQIFQVNMRVGYNLMLEDLNVELAVSAENLLDSQQLQWPGAVKEGIDADMYGNSPYDFDPPRQTITTPKGAEAHRRTVMGTLGITW